MTKAAKTFGMPFDQSSVSSDAGLGNAADGLYLGWITGWSHQACRNLYFHRTDWLDRGRGRPNIKAKRILLQWLSTYYNLVIGWNPVNMGPLTDALKKMISDVESENPKRSFEDDTQFKLWFAAVAGAIQARIPYAFYAEEFASCSSIFRYMPAHGRDVTDLLKSLGTWLERMRNSIPPGVYDIITDDISKIRRFPEEYGGFTVSLDNTTPEASNGRGESTGTHQTANTARVVCDKRWAKTKTWAELILGTIGVRDTLNGKGKAIHNLFIGAIGVTLFTIVGGLTYLVFYIISRLLNIGLGSLALPAGGDILSAIQSLLAILTTVGLSLSLLVRRAWRSLQDFEPWMAVRLARQKWARSDDDVRKQRPAIVDVSQYE